MFTTVGGLDTSKAGVEMFEEKRSWKRLRPLMDERGRERSIGDMMGVVYFDAESMEPAIIERLIQESRINPMGATEDQLQQETKREAQKFYRELHEYNTGWVSKHISDQGKVTYSLRGFQVIRMPYPVTDWDGREQIGAHRDRHTDPVMQKLHKYTHLPLQEWLEWQTRDWFDGDAARADAYSAESSYYGANGWLRDGALEGRAAILLEGEIKQKIVEAAIAAVDGKEQHTVSLPGITMFVRAFRRALVSGGRPDVIYIMLDADALSKRLKRANNVSDSETASYRIARLLEQTIAELRHIIEKDIAVRIVNLSEIVPQYIRHVGDPIPPESPRVLEGLERVGALVKDQEGGGEITEEAWRILEEALPFTKNTEDEEAFVFDTALKAPDDIMLNADNPKDGRDSVVRALEKHAYSADEYGKRVELDPILFELDEMRRRLRNALDKARIAKKRGFDIGVARERIDEAEALFERYTEATNEYRSETLRARTMMQVPADRLAIHSGVKRMRPGLEIWDNRGTRVVPHVVPDSEDETYLLSADINLFYFVPEEDEDEKRRVPAESVRGKRHPYFPEPLTLRGVTASDIQRSARVKSAREFLSDDRLRALYPRLVRGNFLITGGNLHSELKNNPQFFSALTSMQVYGMLIADHLHNWYPEDHEFRIVNFYDTGDGERRARVRNALSVLRPQKDNEFSLETLVPLEWGRARSKRPDVETMEERIIGLQEQVRRIQNCFLSERGDERYDARDGIAAVGRLLIDWYEEPVRSIAFLSEVRLKLGLVDGDQREAHEEELTIGDACDVLRAAFQEQDQRFTPLIGSLALERWFGEVYHALHSLPSKILLSREMIDVALAPQMTRFADIQQRYGVSAEAVLQELEAYMNELVGSQLPSSRAVNRRCTGIRSGTLDPLISDLRAVFGVKRMPETRASIVRRGADIAGKTGNASLIQAISRLSRSYRTVAQYEPDERGKRAYKRDVGIGGILNNEEKLLGERAGAALARREERIQSVCDAVGVALSLDEIERNYIMHVDESDLVAFARVLSLNELLTKAGAHTGFYSEGAEVAPVFKNGALVVPVMDGLDIRDLWVAPCEKHSGRVLFDERMRCPQFIDVPKDVPTPETRVFLHDTLTRARGETLWIATDPLRAIVLARNVPTVGLRGTCYISDEVARAIAWAEPREIVFVIPSEEQGMRIAAVLSGEKIRAAANELLLTSIPQIRVEVFGDNLIMKSIF